MEEDKDRAIKNIEKDIELSKEGEGFYTEVLCNKEDLENLLTRYKQQQAELEKKDKVINEMAKHIQENEFYDDIICMEKNCKNEECHGECGEDCIKEYFTNKVEREGK